MKGQGESCMEHCGMKRQGESCMEHCGMKGQGESPGTRTIVLS